MKYEEIKHLMISDLSEIDRKIWIMDEITELVNDFGTTIDNDLLLHTTKRLLDKLNTAYRSWYVADVHAAFQTGLSGAYGSFRKVTVQALFHFLKQAQNQMSASRANAAELESITKNRVVQSDSIVTEFLIFATTRMICLEYAAPGYKPLEKKQVSPAIIELAKKYDEAKRAKKLHDFETGIRNASLNFIEI